MKLDESDFQAIFSGLVRDAESFTDDEISPRRAFNTDFYKGKVDIEDQPNRSKMVSRDVRDTVMSILPSIMRVFFSSQKAVEYTPTGPEDEEIAAQATDYANYLINDDNDGYKIMYSAFKDALIRGCGVVKVWWDEQDQTITERYTGLDEATLQMIQIEPDVKVEILGTTFDTVTNQDPTTGQMVQTQAPFFEVKVTKKIKKGRVKIAEMPGEEVIVAREDKELGQTFIAHRCYLTVSELVSMGYDRDLVETNAMQDEFPDNPEWIARTDYAMYETAGSANNPAMRKVLYVEAYCKIDRDGDGIAESLKVCAIGAGNEIVLVEETEGHPFVAFTCDQEPHVSELEGSCPADDVLDIQRLKSSVLRNTLDSAAQALNPRTEVVEGQANVQDVLNNEVGAIIRVKAAGAVNPLVTPDLTATGLNMLAYADEVKESRTGLSKAAMGLDPDSMRGTAVNAANAMVSASQSRIELITRNLANGYKNLFKKLLGLTIKHQEQPRVVKLRKKWVRVDPRTWNANMDVKINVALGTGTNAEKLNILSVITQKQEQTIQMLGPSNPIVSLSQYSNALSKMVELGGFVNTESFVSDLPADFQLPPPQPQPDQQAQMAELLAQVEREKTQAKMQIDQAKMQADAQIKAAQMELDRAQMQAEFERKNAELEIKMAKLQLEREKIASQREIEEAKLIIEQLNKMREEQRQDEMQYQERQDKANAESRAEEVLSNAVESISDMLEDTNQNYGEGLNE